jgi:hypothetical protein
MRCPKDTGGEQPQKTKTRLRPAAAAVSIGILTMSACSSHSGGSSPANSLAGIPLATAVTTSTGMWATVAMGHLDDPTNTFWELFTLPSGGQRWTEHTPPDVADNGGLVIAPTTAGAVIGFRPSQLLSFSPLASTTDGGTSYTPALLSGGLANVPDSLSISPSGQAVALTTAQVLTSASMLSAWQPVTTQTAIEASPAGKACGVEQLTAVATTDTGVLVGAACSTPGIVGLLQQAGSTFVSAAVPLPTADAKGVVEVLRIKSDDQGVAALLGVRDESSTSYIAAWSSAPGSGAWTLSPPQASPGTLISTAVTSGAGFAVLTRTAAGQMAAAVVAGPGSSWTQLPAPPAGTATISVAGTRSDALVVDSATFTDYQLTAGQWVKAQTLQVAVPYGSSG